MKPITSIRLPITAMQTRHPGIVVLVDENGVAFGQLENCAELLINSLVNAINTNPNEPKYFEAAVVVEELIPPMPKVICNFAK